MSWLNGRHEELQSIYLRQDQVTSLFPSLPALSPLSQYYFLCLSSTCLRKLIENFDLGRDHEFTDIALLFRPIDYMSTTHCATIFGCHICLWSLTPLFVCDCDYCNFENIWVFGKH